MTWAPVNPTTEWSFTGPITGIPELTAPRLGNTANIVKIDVDVPENANGVLYSVGGYAGGLTVFVKNGILNYEYNLFLLDRTKIKASQKLPKGKAEIEIISTIEKPALWAPMDITLKINGEQVGAGKVPKTAPSIFSFNDGFDIGQDLGSPVSEAYFDQAPFAFDGKLTKLNARYPNAKQ